MREYPTPLVEAKTTRNPGASPVARLNAVAPKPAFVGDLQALISAAGSANMRDCQAVYVAMWYAIIGTDAVNTQERRKAVRPAHLERLEKLLDEGRLLLAGPFPAIDAEDPGPAGFTGSLIIAEFEDIDAARRWAHDDPYVGAGVYRDVSVQPFRKVLP